MTELEKYYNKFNEDHRLTTRHGIVEFTTTMKYILQYANQLEKQRGQNPDSIKILDIGAGTGRYSIALNEKGYDVTAVELVKRNLEVLRAKHTPVKTWQGNAMDLHFLDNKTFDITLVLGPMYHLASEQEKLKAFSEALRVTKDDGFIFVGYIMNEYAMIQYCFSQDKILECLKNGSVSSDFHCVSSDKELYSYLRLTDIDELNKKAGARRVKIFAPDGPSDYIRQKLNAMDTETFEQFKLYVQAIAERPELLGCSSHTVDIVKTGHSNLL